LFGSAAKVNLRDANTIKQVMAESSGLDFRVQIPMRGADNAHVYFARARLADGRNLSFLENAQQTRLHACGDVSDLVQKERATACGFKESDLVADCACEGASFVSEQLAGNKCFGEVFGCFAQERDVSVFVRNQHAEPQLVECRK